VAVEVRSELDLGNGESEGRWVGAAEEFSFV